MRVILNLSERLRLVIDDDGVNVQETVGTQWKEKTTNGVGKLLVNQNGVDGVVPKKQPVWVDVPRNENEIRAASQSLRVRFDRTLNRWEVEEWYATHDGGAFAWLPKELEFMAY